MAIDCRSAMTLPPNSARTMDYQSLKCVHIIFRHGNRTPFHRWDVKPLNLPDVTWTEGYEVLTDSGKEKMFRLGEYFRQQYDELITDDLKRVQVNSSKSDRCIGSVIQVLRGLFSHKHQQIPIDLGICGEENGLTMVLTCKDVDDFIVERIRSPEFQTYHKSNSDIMKRVADEVGAEKTSFDAIVALYDNYVVYKDHGFALPPWFNDQMEQEMNNFLGRGYAIILESRQLSKLAYGLLFRALSERLTKMDSSQSNDVKMYLYSAHDSTLMSIMSIVGVFDDKMPPYGASIAIEVHQVGEEHHLKFIYLPEPDSRKPQLLKLPMANGEEMCLVKTFVDSLHDVISNNDDFKCDHRPH